MRAEHLPLVVVFALAISVGTANAALYNFNVVLDGLQETPPVATPGFGSATGTFDSDTGAMNLSGTFNSLIGTTTDAHVHGYAAVGSGPAGVVFGLTIDLGVTSGNFSGSGVIPPARIPDALNGLTYINVHSTFRPGGEIRGQIFPLLIPEPASAALLAIGVVALGMLRRRSRTAA